MNPLRYPIRFLILGTLAALSFQAVGKFAPSRLPLEREWGMELDQDFTKLPVDGELSLKKFPWADTYTESGAQVLLERWYQTEYAPAVRFRARDLTVDDMKKMDRGVRSSVANEQSGANLFDLFRGRTNYPLARDIKKILYSKNGAAILDSWMNFGWAVAATSFGEPTNVSRTVFLPNTGQAVDLELGSTDVKAYFAYYYGVAARQHVKVYKTKGVLDAASFHLLLANMIAKEEKPFVVDVDPSAGILYRPIGAFHSDIRLAENSENLYEVTTTVDYATRLLPQKGPNGIFNKNLDEKRDRITYRYTISTDSSGKKIIGSAWVGDNHPDFAWRVKELPSIDHEFTALRGLYEEATLK